MKIKRFDTGNGCFAEIEQVNESEWTRLLFDFEDSSIYQTWTYGRVRWGAERLSHIVIKDGARVVGLAQVTMMKVPFLKIGIAYVPWGPLWRRKDGKYDLSSFQLVIKALKDFYTRQMGLLLRISPNIIDSDDSIKSVLEKELYGWTKEHYRTFLLDLSRPLDVIRKGFDQKWRNQLNRAERNGLIIETGTDIQLYQCFLDLQKEMRSRKSFIPGVDYDEFGRIQEQLPDSQKMKIAICKYDGKAVSSIVASAHGDTGIYLLGATGNEGLTLKGSYLLQWHMIQWLKEKGFKWYDLGGIDPESNPGVHHFKAGMGGMDASFVGQFEVMHSRVSSAVIHSAEYIKKKMQNYVSK